MQEISFKISDNLNIMQGRAARFLHAMGKLGFKNVSQLARKTGLNRSTAYYLARGGKPSEATSKILYNIGFNTIWLETGEGPVTLLSDTNTSGAGQYRVQNKGIVLKINETMVTYDRKGAAEKKQLIMELDPRDFFPLVIETLPQLTDNELSALKTTIENMLKGRIDGP